MGFGGCQKCCPDNAEFDDDDNDADDDDDYDDDSDADDDDDSNEYDDDDYDDNEYDDNGMFYFLFRLLQEYVTDMIQTILRHYPCSCLCTNAGTNTELRRRAVIQCCAAYPLCDISSVPATDRAWGRNIAAVG